MLKDRVGEVFEGVVVDYDPANAVGRVQLAEPAVHARIQGPGLVEGTTIRAELLEASIRDRLVLFSQPRPTTVPLTPRADSSTGAVSRFRLERRTSSDQPLL